jgi:MFS transporter, Spinster family, sphingosine-1-phosphate transporter
LVVVMHAGDAVGDASGNGSGPRTLAAASVPQFALVTFLVLFAMNLLDYTDRWVLSAVLPQVRDDLALSNEQAGWLSAWFLISYTAISPFMGYAGDRMKRTWLLAIGVGVWSLATLGSGLAHSYDQLRIARAFLGIGEATYGVIAPTILMDLFSREKRSRVMSWFYLAMPLGGAIGMGLGGFIGKHYGWHAAFFVVGAPGLLAAFLALLLPEPIRGLSEGVDPDKLKAHEKAGASVEDYIDLMVNSSYTYSVLGMAFYTFAIGGLAYWLPTFLTVTKGIEQVRATTLLGLTTLFAAVIGMSAGGVLADRLAKTNPRALFVVPGSALVASIPFILVAIYARSEPWIYAGIFCAEALMFINTGPCNAVIANVVMPNMRSAAYAVAIFAIHLLGDIWSPTLMGWVADTFGQRDAMMTVFGRLLTAIGALPTARAGRDAENLTAGMLVVVPAVLLAGVVLLAGARHLPREMALMLAKLKAKPRHAAADPFPSIAE